MKRRSVSSNHRHWLSLRVKQIIIIRLCISAHNGSPFMSMKLIVDDVHETSTFGALFYLRFMIKMQWRQPAV